LVAPETEASGVIGSGGRVGPASDIVAERGLELVG
jgi:hypothetical protein